MKKILFFIGIICAGIIATWSCSSDEKSITEEPQEGTTSLEFGLDLQSLGTKGADKICLDLQTIHEMIKNNQIEAYVKVKNSSGAYVLDQAIPLRAIVDANGKIVQVVTEAKDVVVSASTYTLESMQIRKKMDGATPTIYYATVLEQSPIYLDNSKLVSDCVAKNGQSMKPVIHGKTYHQVCLHCLQNYTPADFGFSIYDPKLYKHYCIPFVVDICEMPGGLDLQGHGEYFIYRAVISGNGSIPAPGDWELIASGTYGDMTNDGNDNPLPGKICFYDDLRLDNSKEWYSIKLYNKKPPLTCCYIETVPFCDKTYVRNNKDYAFYYNNKNIKGVPLEKMLRLATTDNPGWLENHNTVHFWWCSNLPNECAPNLYSWPKDKDGTSVYTSNTGNDALNDDFFTWYDSQVEVLP